MTQSDTVTETVPAETAPDDVSMQESGEKGSAEEEEEVIVPIQPKPKRVPFERREEILLRKRKDQREKKMAWLQKRRKRGERKTKNQLKIQLKTFNFRTPHKDIKKFIKTERQLLFAKRRMRITKKVGHFRYKIPKDIPELLLVVRIKENHFVAPEFRKLMGKMGLNSMLQAVLMKKSEELLDTLIRLGPFTTYGNPSTEAVRDLLRRRGHHIKYESNKRKKVPLTDNRMIEDELGEYDVICVNDLVEEIVNIGPAFDQCIKFLGPFRVTPPKSKRFNYNRQFKDGGDWGYRPGNKIMDLFI